MRNKRPALGGCKSRPSRCYIISNKIFSRNVTTEKYRDGYFLLNDKETSMSPTHRCIKALFYTAGIALLFILSRFTVLSSGFILLNFASKYPYAASRMDT